MVTVVKGTTADARMMRRALTTRSSMNEYPSSPRRHGTRRSLVIQVVEAAHRMVTVTGSNPNASGAPLGVNPRPLGVRIAEPGLTGSNTTAASRPERVSGSLSGGSAGG